MHLLNQIKDTNTLQIKRMNSSKQNLSESGVKGHRSLKQHTTSWNKEIGFKNNNNFTNSENFNSINKENSGKQSEGLSLQQDDIYNMFDNHKKFGAGF